MRNQEIYVYLNRKNLYKSKQKSIVVTKSKLKTSSRSISTYFKQMAR